MTYNRQATPATPVPPTPLPERDYEVLSEKYVGGEVGDVIKLALTDNQELSLLQSGAVKRAVVVRSSAAVKERK